MPMIQVQLWKGVNQETKNKIAASITDLMVQQINCPAEAVTVIMDDIEKSHWFIGGKNCEN